MCAMWLLTCCNKFHYLLTYLLTYLLIVSQARGPKTPVLRFLTVVGCPSYTAVHRRQLAFSVATVTKFTVAK